MKAYGIPRNRDLDKYPDKVDIRRFGLKGSIGSFPGKSGDFHPLAGRTSSQRNKTRRIWKKKARRQTQETNDA